jgi:maleylpyruvate isomerase
MPDDAAPEPDSAGMAAPPVDAAPDPGAVLSEVERGTAGLLRTLDRLDDAAMAEPSLLPGWTRGHVVTHIARNADAMVNLLTWARTGVETLAYPSMEVRNADIEAGAGRVAEDLRSDVVRSHERLMTAARRLPDEAWGRAIRWGRDDSKAYAWIVPVLRESEVEIHHVDLDTGYTPAHWSAAFVARTLTRCSGDFAGRADAPGVTLRATDTERSWQIGDGRTVVSGPGPALLGWLLGRTAGAGLSVDPSGPLPTLGAWR